MELEHPLSDGHLFAEIAGTRDRGDLVLLHGGLLDRRMWDGEFERLSGGWRVVRYDARAHGRSSTPREVVSHRRDLRALIEGLGLRRPVIVGCSLGARTALDLALEAPEAVGGLVLVSPGVSGLPVTGEHHESAARDRLAAAQRGDLAAVVETLLREWVDGPSRGPGDTSSDVRERCARMFCDTLSAHFRDGQRWREDELGAAGRLGELRVPVSLIVGGLDSPATDDAARCILEGSPRSTAVVVEGVGHMVPLEAPEAFARALDDAMADVTARVAA